MLLTIKWKEYKIMNDKEKLTKVEIKLDIRRYVKPPANLYK